MSTCLADITATASIDGVDYMARIEQYPERAFVSIWGGSREDDTSVETSDVRRELAYAMRDDLNLHPQVVALLKQVASVFALSELFGGQPGLNALFEEARQEARQT